VQYLSQSVRPRHHCRCRRPYLRARFSDLGGHPSAMAGPSIRQDARPEPSARPIPPAPWTTLAGARTRPAWSSSGLNHPYQRRSRLGVCTRALSVSCVSTTSRLSLFPRPPSSTPYTPPWSSSCTGGVSALSVAGRAGSAWARASCGCSRRSEQNAADGYSPRRRRTASDPLRAFLLRHATTRTRPPVNAARPQACDQFVRDSEHGASLAYSGTRTYGFLYAHFACHLGATHRRHHRLYHLALPVRRGDTSNGCSPNMPISQRREHISQRAREVEDCHLFSLRT
jgi:hypothetical protein